MSTNNSKGIKALAAKYVLEQGIECIGVNFISPFSTFSSENNSAIAVAKCLKIPLRIITKGKDYIEIIRNPKYGYGKGLNPCIDCRIYILMKAKELMEKLNIDFIVTGEVIGQRPMSQYKNTLLLIEREALLNGKILRPLSAKLLPETECEKKRLVDREKLLAIKGRSRKIQLQLAKKLCITGWSTPAGGCLLTQKDFASKLKDLFEYKSKVTWKDIMLLKIGRHFRIYKSKIIVGRNESENKLLLNLKCSNDYWFEVPNYGSPIALLQGAKDDIAIKLAASLTARYSDCKQVNVPVNYTHGSIVVKAIETSLIEKLKIGCR